MFNPGGIDHIIIDIGLVLSITFMVPFIGAIAGTIVASLPALQTGQKETG